MMRMRTGGCGGLGELVGQQSWSGLDTGGLEKEGRRRVKERRVKERRGVERGSRGGR